MPSFAQTRSACVGEHPGGMGSAASATAPAPMTPRTAAMKSLVLSPVMDASWTQVEAVNSYEEATLAGVEELLGFYFKESPYCPTFRPLIALGKSQHPLRHVAEDELLADRRDAGDHDFAQETFHVKLLGVAVAAMGEDRPLAGVPGRPGAEILGRIGLG